VSINKILLKPVKEFRFFAQNVCTRTTRVLLSCY